MYIYALVAVSFQTVVIWHQYNVSGPFLSFFSAYCNWCCHCRVVRGYTSYRERNLARNKDMYWGRHGGQEPLRSCITMKSHECHEVTNHRSLDCLFNSLCGPTPKKHQSPHYWPFVRRINRWAVNSPHKLPVTRKKAFIWWRHHGLACLDFPVPLLLIEISYINI